MIFKYYIVLIFFFKRYNIVWPRKIADTQWHIANITDLYGSKSAPKLWYNCLYQFIIDLGFKSVAGHPCLFIRVTRVRGETITIVIGVFVDDLLVTGNCKSAINEVKERMNKIFVLSDQDYLEFYLGVEISHLDDKTLLLHQTAYATKIISNFKMSECKPVKTPLPRDCNLSLMDSPDEVDPRVQSEYRAIVGSLMYSYHWTLLLRFCQDIFTSLV
jgi:hypothetical protein